MIPAANCWGETGTVGVSMTITAWPVQTPFTEMESPLCTSENRIFPLLLILCILISTPFLNSNEVACPIPPVNVKVMLTCRECGALSATSEVVVSFGMLVWFVGLVVALEPGWSERWAWGLRFGIAFFTLLAMGRFLMALKLQKRTRLNS